jgi:ribonuclease D
MTAELITDERALADLCRALASADWLALDTEFLRERTYRARLCLVQVATPEVVACIDPLALPGLAPLAELLHAPRPLKVLHAARQDLEVFHDLEARVPQPVFDTQVAAAYLGHDDQVGYGALVTEITGVTLAKAHTRTDWSRRPLSAEQLEYAADDVRYLRPLYEALRERLEARGRLAWAEDDCRQLTDPALYRADPEQAWRRLKGGADLPPANQQLLRALAAWRERAAQERNLPRAWVVRDEVLFELARRAPETGQALAGVSTLEDGARRRFGPELLATLAAARAAEPQVLWPRLAPLTPAQAALGKRLMARVRELAQEHALAPAVIATRREVEQLVRGADPGELLRGWRAELIAPALRPLLAPAGDLASA